MVRRYPKKRPAAKDPGVQQQGSDPSSPKNNNNNNNSNDEDGDDNLLDSLKIKTDDDSAEPDDPTLDMHTIMKTPNSDYYGMHLYFDDKKNFKNPEIIKKVEAGIKFMEKNSDVSEKTLRGPSFNINIDRFFKDKEFMSEWSTFEHDIIENPQETLDCLGLSLHQILVSIPMNNDPLSIDNTDLPMIRVKIINLKPIIPLHEVKLSFYGKLITTRGCVVRVGRTKHVTQWVSFICLKCCHWQVVKQPDGIYTLPNKCRACGAGKFKPRCGSRFVKTTPFQVIKLQEHFSLKQDDPGRMPRILEIELFDDLVDICMPGNN